MPTPESLNALLVYVEAAEYPWTLHRRSTLGLYYLAQHAADAGFRVKIDELSANDEVTRRLIRLVRRHGVGLLGFYVDHDNQWDLGRIIPEIHRSCPACDIVLGGPQATSAPDALLGRIDDALCCVLGEGEATFVELLRMAPRSGPALERCPGLALRKGDEVVTTAPRTPVADLDSFSIPRRERLRLDGKAPGTYSILTGRGCTGRCAVCFEGTRRAACGPRHRLHSVGRVLEEVEYLHREFAPNYIAFLDDTFVADANRLREFCHGMIARYRGEVKWFCEARVDSLVRNTDLLPLMIEAGLIRMQVGGESGCQHILDAYRKDISLGQLRGAVEAARDCGLLSLYMNFIVGGAFETRETARQTREFASELLSLAPGCLAVGHSFFTPYPGTPIHADPSKYGIQIIDPDVVTGFGDSHVFCRTEELGRPEIVELGMQFTDQTRRAMGNLAAELPLATIERLYRAEICWGLDSEWLEWVNLNPANSVYFRALLDGNCGRMPDAIQSAGDSAIPLRTVELRSSIGPHYVVRTAGGNTLRLDAFDGMLVELAAGKLMLGEIIEVVATRLPSTDLGRLRETVLARYRYLDEQRVVLWRGKARRPRARATAKARPVASVRN